MLSARPFALDGDLYHAKTPARATRDRNLLQENLHRVPMTVNGKGKALQTPRRAMTVQSHKALSHSVKPTIRVQKPLGDKTPFPNRVANAVPFDAPAPQTAKLAKLVLLEAPQEALPEALLRPSSARKSLRAPRLSGSIQLDFKTPVTRGDHWNVSDGEIDVDLNEEAEEVTDVRGEDDDEIEYMPPTAVAPVYEPSFEMPDYTQLGAAIRGLAHSYKLDDADDLYYSHDAHIDVESRDLWRASGFASLHSPSRWDTPELAPLENELLIHDKPTNSKNKASRPQVRPTPAIQHKHTSSLPAFRATSSARSIPNAATKAPSGPSRPLSRAPSATTTAPTSRTTSTSSTTSSTTAATRPAVARARSQTTSQIARPASAPSTKLDAPNAHARAGVAVPPKPAASRAQVPVARSKTATSVYATTSRAAPVAAKPQPARLTATRPTPVSSRTGAAPAVSRLTSATTGKAVQPRIGSAPGQRRAGVTPTAQEEGGLLHFDDPLDGGEDFMFNM